MSFAIRPLTEYGDSPEDFELSFHSQRVRFGEAVSHTGISKKNYMNVEWYQEHAISFPMYGSALQIQQFVASYHRKVAVPDETHQYRKLTPSTRAGPSQKKLSGP